MRTRTAPTCIVVMALIGAMHAAYPASALTSEKYLIVLNDNVASKITILGQGPLTGNVTVPCFEEASRSTGALVTGSIEYHDANGTQTKTFTLKLQTTGPQLVLSMWFPSAAAGWTYTVTADVTESTCSGAAAWRIQFDDATDAGL